MNTREKIILLGDNLIRKKGYNAFSFGDISKELGIKNASIHYHFTTKTTLVIAIIQKHHMLLEKFKRRIANENPLQKLIQFLSVYAVAKSEGRISILGALSNDYYSFEPEVQAELKILTDNTLNWLTDTLKDGKKEGFFNYNMDHHTKALMIITNILGAEHLSRITYHQNFLEIKKYDYKRFNIITMRRVVVTGIGAVTPIGNNIDDFWVSLTEGKSGAAPITRFDTSKFKTKFGCELKNFNPLDFIEKAEARKYDLYTQYALVAVEEAVKNGNIDFEKMNRNRIGVIWGSGNGGIETFQQQMTEYISGDGTPRFSPFFIPKMIVDIASGVISIKYGLRGVNFTTVSACATSNTAIIDAYNYIKWNKADMIITGGSEAAITESSVGGFNSSKALSTNNENPQAASRPFDVDRDGFVIGEGAGAVILEELESAKQRGANIIAEIVGGGMAADAYHLTGTHPDGEGAYLGMLAALEDAGIQAYDIDYLNVHATSTPQGDISELKAAERVFGRENKLNISATKSMTGHLLGAAGAVEAITCIKAVSENIIPPTINTLEPEPEYKDIFDFTLGKKKSKEVNYAMNNTFGFGGHIATSIFKKYTE
ncbi:beta-ketoacyl-[acyl-carrier-protein] synthase II [Elizabethkingia anophelis]|nr:beta-ketoacyl-[acyl-carrier-protein] synthase II [Elizabethkingia anophelis]